MSEHLIRNSVQVVQEHLEALNRHDLETFVSLVTPDIVVSDADGVVLLNGRGAFRVWYGEHFGANPQLKSDLLDRMSLGQWVIDEVLVTGYHDGSQRHVISVIRVVDEQIASIRLILG